MGGIQYIFVELAKGQREEGKEGEEEEGSEGRRNKTDTEMRARNERCQLDDLVKGCVAPSHMSDILSQGLSVSD